MPQPMSSTSSAADIHKAAMFQGWNGDILTILVYISGIQQTIVGVQWDIVEYRRMIYISQQKDWNRNQQS